MAFSHHTLAFHFLGFQRLASAQASWPSPTPIFSADLQDEILTFYESVLLTTLPFSKVVLLFFFFLKKHWFSKAEPNWCLLILVLLWEWRGYFWGWSYFQVNSFPANKNMGRKKGKKERKEEREREEEEERKKERKREWEKEREREGGREGGKGREGRKEGKSHWY